MKVIQTWNNREWVDIESWDLPVGHYYIRIVNVHRYWIVYKEEEKISLILRRWIKPE